MTVLHPNQFRPNEAWLAFQLNDALIETEQDGAFNCVCLMDAATGYIFGNAFVPAQEVEPSQLDSLRLLKSARARSNVFPATLLLPKGQYKTHLASEAERQGITVVRVAKSHLLVFTREARQGFKEHVQRGAARGA